MAKVSAHGREIGTLEFVTSRKRYMSDGVILVDRGGGWKIHGHLKAGWTPEAAFARAKARQDEAREKFPCNFEYRKQLHEIAGRTLDQRGRLHYAVESMPDDPDGVWSEVCDGYTGCIEADFAEIVMLCRFYKLAVRENTERAGGLVEA